MGLLRWIWTTLASLLYRHVFERSSGERRQQLRAFLGAAASRSQPYRMLPVWPLAGLLQWLGVCFNLSVLGTTLALVLFSDRAFGWQSAVHFTPEEVHGAIRWLALPWSWLMPDGQGIPTLNQVEGSRIILKDGIRQLATGNLVAWWPFLCLAVLTYGLLPRLLILSMCSLQGRRAMETLSFDNVISDRLHERLTAPIVATQGVGLEHAREALPAHGVPSKPPTAEGTRSAPENGALFLADPELHGSLEDSEWRRAITDRWGVQIAAFYPAGLNPTELQPVLPELRRWKWASERPTIVMIQEAWAPPIAETMDALRLLRHTLGKGARLILTLVGRPEKGSPLTAVRDSEFRIWERETAALGDPQLRVEPLRNHG